MCLNEKVYYMLDENDNVLEIKRTPSAWEEHGITNVDVLKSCQNIGSAELICGFSKVKFKKIIL